ncbi:MAG: PSD1 and planctomycete cytochrome C domain-containing protein, partial [Pirellulaceae bacterium]
MRWEKFHWRCAMLGLAVLSMAMSLQAWEPPAKSRALPAPTKLTVDFVRDIQPLFRKNCYSCHGLETQEAGLRLDRRKLALQGSDRGSVILAGKSADSRLVQVLVGQDQEIGVMPPDGEGTPLTDAQIALMRGWIDQGVNWPDSADENTQSKHWAFQAIKRPGIPGIADASLDNPIDAFVLKKLRKHNLTLAPPVGRSRLIRRLYLDLLGLTPPPEEVVKFLQDERADAYQQLVQRILKSPHYGERWGRHWLDLARYADSDGYEKDRPRPFAWQYRDWVINAFNADMPYDDFTVAQIAGDMLPKATREHRVASGFHRNTLHNTEGGTDKEEDRVKKTVDRINTVSTIWLGLTVGCAQCHAHKYDPISQREYYSMYAFFNNIDEADIVAPSLQESQQYATAKDAFDRDHQRLQDALAAYEKTKLPAAQVAWEKEVAGQEVSWKPLKTTQATAAKGAALMVQADQSILATGRNEQSDLYTVTGEMTAGSLAAIRLEVLPHKTLVKQGPGRAANGNFVLTTFRAALTENGQQARSVPLKLVRARADFSQQDWAVALAINMNPKDGWAVSPQLGKRHVAAFELEEPIAVAAGSKLTVVLDQAYTGSGTHNIGYFRISTTDLQGPVPLDGVPAPVIEAVAVAEKDRNDQQRKTIRDYFRAMDSEISRLNAAVAEHQKKSPKQGGSKAQVVAERSQARVANIHVRGNFLDKGPQVTADTLEVLPAIESKAKQPNRLDFAHWLIAAQHPLTARVVVNRVWYRYFGRGLVASIDDFGIQGEQPSHPELLDFLASELQQNRWSLKYLHRLIVTSQVYQQSSGARPAL